MKPATSDAEHAEPAEDVDLPVEIRFLAPTEAARLTEAIERSYGRSYDAAWVYDPDEIRRRLETGVMRSIVGVTPGAEVVGHLALHRVTPDAPAGHAGQAVVDPRYRGHHLFTSLKRDMATWCTEAGLVGMYSEATAAHPYSQAALVALGAHETGFMIGYIPAAVSYTAIHEGPAPRRQSVALFWLTTNPVQDRTVHPPAWHRSIVAEIYAHNRIERTLADEADAPVLEGTTRWTVEEHDGHNGATITVEHLGADVLQALRGFLAAEARRGRDVLYLELPLHDPRTASLPAEVHDELGFFFGGVVPELHDGDVLRLQWLNGVEADPSDVAVASDFGRELLAYIFERKNEHAR